MGISRSGSTVMAYAMKKQHWPLDVAQTYVKDRRSVVKPNDGFMKQLQTYNGILNARSEPQIGGGGQSSFVACCSLQPRVVYKRGFGPQQEKTKISTFFLHLILSLEV